jgi:hypothetical protein
VCNEGAELFHRLKRRPKKRRKRRRRKSYVFLIFSLSSLPVSWLLCQKFQRFEKCVRFHTPCRRAHNFFFLSYVYFFTRFCSMLIFSIQKGARPMLMISRRMKCLLKIKKVQDPASEFISIRL